jgi:hypothetical protein
MQNLIRSRWSQIHDDMDVRGRVAGHVNYAASSCCRQQIRQHRTAQHTCWQEKDDEANYWSADNMHMHCNRVSSMLYY